jgi:hypothetical protein
LTGDSGKSKTSLNKIRKNIIMGNVSEIVQKYVEITQFLAIEVEKLKLENERKEQIILAQAETIRKLAYE